MKRSWKALDGFNDAKQLKKAVKNQRTSDQTKRANGIQFEEPINVDKDLNDVEEDLESMSSNNSSATNAPSRISNFRDNSYPSNCG